MNDNETWILERRFWLDGVPVYEAHLHDEAVMVFPGMGILDRSTIIDSMRDAPRWRSLEITNERIISAAKVRVLAYAAEATRDGEEPYRAHCISTYVQVAGAWLMVSHQHTPQAL